MSKPTFVEKKSTGRLARPQPIAITNNYVEEMSSFRPTVPPRPSKPLHLSRVPSLSGSLALPPPVPPKPKWLRASNRDDSCLRSSPLPSAAICRPPTLDEILRREVVRCEPVRQESQPRPGRHGYLCPQCKRCTCAKCTVPRIDLEASCHPAQQAVDRVSCLWAIKACAYHLTYDEDSHLKRQLSDTPASCSQQGCTFRWMLLGAVTMFLPCLVIYPIYKAGHWAVQRTQNALLPGCKCPHNCK
ncbi:Oidioi.mRNA.OKI2018_I69.XSR.g14912.t1.cds [Oikopleura dioica]|uniref:Oidioi.mRNA.OKI2018_I69.XSR.g14912.t1.cds n=1 Tax=Oikopleura dioica TaxID=34765 RepID=A0ABN7SGC2_OIKDI|nr:Oidioi.mRNA.OKI2018_I69.XSR.g14912.t1.cds [Oikopleura dioica]